MKWIILIILFNMKLSSAGLHCEKFTNQHRLALRITKTWNAENELRFGVKINKDCSFSDEEVMNVYWSLAKREGSPCEEPFDDEVEDLIGFKTLDELKKNMARKIDDQTLQVTLPNLPGFAKKVDSDKKVSTDIYFTLKSQAGKCELASRTLVSGNWISVNRIHNTISLFWLKKVEYYVDESAKLSL